MKKTTIFLMVTLMCSLSSPITIHANSYLHDTYQVLSSTANYLVLRTSQSCKDSGSYIIDKLKGIRNSISHWWLGHKPSTPVVVVYKN